MRLPLALALVLLFVAASPSAAERPRRLLSEEAFAQECRTGEDTVRHCITVQAVRSRLSDGGDQTTLFVSVRKFDPAMGEEGEGEGVEISGFPTLPFVIDSYHFVMDRDGTRAILNFRLPPPEGQLAESQPGITVTWNATDDFSSRKFSTVVVKEKTDEGFTKSRQIEREQERSATAEGVIGPLSNGVPQLPINIASALLDVTKTIQRTQLLEEEPDFPDVAE
jgi:hypothetical protein